MPRNIVRAAKTAPMIKHPVMLLGVAFAKARSRSSTLLSFWMAVMELGIIFETFNGKALQSTWSAKPMQKYLTPNEQLLGTMEPTAVSMDVTALETALLASLATPVATVRTALATL
jgi:hypothetical protein